MPLLAQDKFGRVYQTEGLSEFDDASVGYFAELDDMDNVYLGEIGNVEQKRLQALRNFRKRQDILRKKRHQQKVNHLKKIEAQKAVQNRIVQARIANAQDKLRRKQSAQKMARLRAGRNAFAGYEQTTVGNPLQGWQKGQAIMSSSDWSKVKVNGVKQSEEFGFANYHQVSHPLMGFDYGYYNDMDGMGFFKNFKKKIKLPKIRLPKVKLPKITLPKLPTAKQLGRNFNKVVSDIGKAAGSIIQAPLHFTNQALKHVPIVKDVYRGLDKLTGGTLESIHRTAMLPGKALKGEKISKREFLEGLTNIIKIGGIALTGGAALSVVSATSGALAKGPLGKTPLGKAILTVGEVASISKFGEMGLKKAVEQKVVSEASKAAASAAGKKAGPLGAIVASAAVSATATGFADGGKVPSLKADASSVANTAKQAEAASNIAAAQTIAQIKSGALKFDSESAKNEFMKQAQEQAKHRVQHEFQKKTGIPLGLATQVAQGKIPTQDEIKNKIKNELYGTTKDLENRIAQIPSQMSNSEPLMKKVLEEKSQIMGKELADRKNLVEKTKKEAALKLVDANKNLQDKGSKAIAQRELVTELNKKQDILAMKVKMSGGNLKEKEKYTRELALLQGQLVREGAKLSELTDEAVKAKAHADYVQDEGGMKTLQAEYGGVGAREKYLGNKGYESFIHPMLMYGLV